MKKAAHPSDDRIAAVRAVFKPDRCQTREYKCQFESSQKTAQKSPGTFMYPDKPQNYKHHSSCKLPGILLPFPKLEL